MKIIINFALEKSRVAFSFIAETSRKVVAAAAAAAAATAPAPAPAARELHKKKRTNWFVCIVLAVIILTAVIITIVALTVMKAKTPKFRISGATLTSFNAGTPANPSLQATISPKFSVKNTNFGRYEYRNTTVEFFYRGAKVGEVIIPDSNSGRRSTKIVVLAAVDLILSGSPQLSTDLSAGVVPITSSAQMTGRVMNKNRSTFMNCSMQIVMAIQSITNIVCI